MEGDVRKEQLPLLNNFFFFTPLVSVSIGALTDGKTLSAAPPVLPPARRGASCYKFFLTAIFFSSLNSVRAQWQKMDF